MVTHPTNTTNVVNGATVEFVCIAYGSPLPDVNWYGRSRNNFVYTLYTTGVMDETIIVSGKYFRKSTLTLQNVTVDMWLTCNSSNGVLGNETNSASFSLSLIHGMNNAQH